MPTAPYSQQFLFLCRQMQSTSIHSSPPLTDKLQAREELITSLSHAWMKRISFHKSNSHTPGKICITIYFRSVRTSWQLRKIRFFSLLTFCSAAPQNPKQWKTCWSTNFFAWTAIYSTENENIPEKHRPNTIHTLVRQGNIVPTKRNFLYVGSFASTLMLEWTQSNSNLF